MIRDQKQEKWVMNDKWTVWSQERQADQANAHKEAVDEFACHLTELERENNELQKRVHVSESTAPSRILFQSR